jgi:hypothetical protein
MPQSAAWRKVLADLGPGSVVGQRSEAPGAVTTYTADGQKLHDLNWRTDLPQIVRDPAAARGGYLRR